MNCGAVPKRSAMYGTSGIRMPKPSVSITQKANSAASWPRTAHLLGFVTRHERGHVGARLRRRRPVVTRPADDEVGNAMFVPVRVVIGSEAHDTQLQGGDEPHAVAAAAAHHEQVARRVRLL